MPIEYPIAIVCVAQNRIGRRIERRRARLKKGGVIVDRQKFLQIQRYNQLFGTISLELHRRYSLLYINHGYVTGGS